MSILDAYQRQGKHQDPVFRRVFPNMMYGADEFSVVMFSAVSITYNQRGSKTYQVRRPKGLDARQMSVMVCFRHQGNQLGKIFICLPLKPKEIRDENGNLIGWDVTQPASSRIKKEMDTWDTEHLHLYFQKSCLFLESVIEQFAVDFEEFTSESGLKWEKRLYWDWYDSPLLGTRSQDPQSRSEYHCDVHK